MASKQKYQHYRSSAAVSPACTDWRSAALRRATDRKGGSDAAVRGRRPGREWQWRTRLGCAGYCSIGWEGNLLGSPSKAHASNDLPANQAIAKGFMSATLLKVQEAKQWKMRASPRLCTLAQLVTCQLTSKTALCKALADVPFLAAAKSAAHLRAVELTMSQGTSNFPQWGPEDKARRVAGNIPDGNPYAVCSEFLEISPSGTTLMRLCSLQNHAMTLSYVLFNHRC